MAVDPTTTTICTAKAVVMKLTLASVLAIVLSPVVVALAEGEPQSVYVRSYDGAYIGAGIRKPPGEGPFPAILFIHGGLGGSSVDGMARFTTNPVPDHFYKRGYVVMSTDYRRYHFGEDEIQDVLASYRELESQPFVDKRRIGVIGGSHGGYLTMMLATRIKPAAAVSFAGLSDIEEMFFERGKQMRDGLTSYEQWQQKMFQNKDARARRATAADEGRQVRQRPREQRAQRPDPTEPNGSASFEVAIDLAWRIGGDQQAYQRISPLHNAHKIASPLLYVVGSEDRLRIAGKKVVEAVMDQGYPADYSEHAGMGHGFYWGTRDRNNPPQQFHDALQVTSDFMDRHVKNLNVDK